MKIWRFSSIRFSCWWICENLWKLSKNFTTYKDASTGQKETNWLNSSKDPDPGGNEFLGSSNSTHYQISVTLVSTIFLPSIFDSKMQIPCRTMFQMLIWSCFMVQKQIYIYIVKLQYNKDIWKWRETQQQCIQFWTFLPSFMENFNMCSMAQATTLVW